MKRSYETQVRMLVIEVLQDAQKSLSFIKEKEMALILDEPILKLVQKNFNEDCEIRRKKIMETYVKEGEKKT